MHRTILLLLVFASQFCSAQKQDNNWVFGHHAGLNFDLALPQPFTSGIYSVEDCASISDSSGQLLFYTNGVNVYNRLGQMMPNGDSLATGFQWQYGADAPQSVVILPAPGDAQLYYLFTRSDSALSYSIIDMALDGFNGDLSVKNQLLYNNPVQRFMTAIKHGNGVDWWLITHGLGEKFLAWRLSSSGIDTLVTTSIGLDYNYAGENSDVELVSNLQGTKLAFASSLGIHLVDFDRCHGSFSNFDTIPLPETPYSFAFSPHGTKLYFTFHYNQFPTFLKQLCLDCGGALDSSIKEIYNDYNLDYNLSQIQNGPDGKIYVAMSYWWATDTLTDIYNLNLSVINDPDQLGIDCNFDTATISLGGNYSIVGLPNSPYYNMPPVAGECNDTIATFLQMPDENAGVLYPNPADGEFKITISTDHALISIIDVCGRKVLEQNYRKNEMINVAHLENGVYNVEIKSGNKVSYTKLVKL
ncbi:MAG TPA: T9SS type A sorting domain-containing protein [Chitinophagales bacterium]|nr:T9SS type A sorting domain-containing protein [Chitinophagales bacterium]